MICLTTASHEAPAREPQCPGYFSITSRRLKTRSGRAYSASGRRPQYHYQSTYHFGVVKEAGKIAEYAGWLAFVHILPGPEGLAMFATGIWFATPHFRQICGLSGRVLKMVARSRSRIRFADAYNAVRGRIR